MVNESVFHADGQILEWKWSTNSPLMERPFWTSAYLIDQLLIDCGAPASAEEMGQFIDGLAPSERPIRCFITHAHEDHAGTGKLLTENYHIPVFAPPESIERLREGWDYIDVRKLAWGESGMMGFDAMPYPGDLVETPNGYKFDIVALPGHAPDLHAFIEKGQQWAFVGDLMMPRYEMLFGGTSDIKEDIKMIAESLGKLYQFTDGLDELQIFVSGRGVFDGRDVIQTRIAEINALHERVHALDAELGTGLDESRKLRRMVKLLFGGESFFAGLSQGELSRENLLRSLLDWAIDGP
jgi:glyoxylase-like metal-dependent hydrolase (beta-lactamase superfamily II)